MQEIKVLEVYINFQGIKTHESLLDKLDEVFGFFDGHGRNFDAIFECLSELRYPDEEMTSYNIKKDESILLQIENLSMLPKPVFTFFMELLQDLNGLFINKGEPPLIILMPYRWSSFSNRQ